VAHRIHAIRSLPFIVGCNPTILSVHEQYIRSFHILNDFPAIETPEQEEEFAEILKALLDEHKNVVSNLAQGFKEARKHIKVSRLLPSLLLMLVSGQLEQEFVMLALLLSIRPYVFYSTG
jgi:[3-methyl-2-oxobutanoate dehydrogenase (acetyl-transferring)] kinase